MFSFLSRVFDASIDIKVYAISAVMILANLFFNIIANVSFKFSAQGPTWREVLFWQVAGNLAGLITVITLTVLLKYIPLSIAFPVTTGLTVIGVSLIAAILIFHEEVTAYQWLGTLLVIAGIALLSRR